LTTHNNEFEKPVFNYTMPAYWYHDNMGSAAENYRAFYSSSFGNKDNPLRSLVNRYDQLLTSAGQTLTTDTLFPFANSNLVRGWLSNGNPLTTSRNNAFIEVIRSRKSNQLSAVASSLTLLEPLNSAREFPLFETFNGQSDSCFYFMDCFGDTIPVAAKYHKGRFHFIVMLPHCVEKKPMDINGCYLSASEMIEQYRWAYAVTGELPSGIPSHNPLNYYFQKRGDYVEIINRNNPNNRYMVPWFDAKALFPECAAGVLQAAAIEYVPGWSLYYADAGFQPLSTEREKYLCMPNVYRPLRSNQYVDVRKQHGNATDYQTNIAYDGTFDSFIFFVHNAGMNNFFTRNGTLKSWRWGAETTKYNAQGFEIENMLPYYYQGLHAELDIYSAALYAYGNSLPVAVANNARYWEIGFDGFEQDPHIPVTGSPYARGHLRYANGVISSDRSHTGNYSFRNNNEVNISATVAYSVPANAVGLYLQPNKEYLFSCWVYDSKTYSPLVFSDGSSTMDVAQEEPIEGWQRVECRFTTPSTATNITLRLRTFDKMLRPLYFDDIRVMPAAASMKTYVYDRFNYRLLAELDENNYAVFYNYDEEGVLVQVKKETERGIRTLQTTRQFLRKYVP
jgi:hypothetical protein